VQVVRRPGETPPLSHRGEGAQLPQLKTLAGYHMHYRTPSRSGSDKRSLL